MTMAFDMAVIQAVSRLKMDPDFRTFMDGVKARRDAARDGFEHATDAWKAGKLQGESLLASELITLRDHCDEYLETAARAARQQSR